MRIYYLAAKDDIIIVRVLHNKRVSRPFWKNRSEEGKMIRNKSLFISLVAALFISLAPDDVSAADAKPPISDLNNGYAIPHYGDDVEIVNTFQAPGGHLIFEIWFKRDGVLHDDFFDTKTMKRMFEKRETEIAENDAVRAELVKKAGLEKLEPALFTLKLPDSTEIHDSYTGDKTCIWPYDSEIKVQAPDRVSI